MYTWIIHALITKFSLITIIGRDIHNAQVSLSEDYMITLNLTVTPPGDPPDTLSLHFTKIPIPTSCSFNLSSNGTVIHDHSAVDVTDYHSVNTSSFADQNFELDVFCTGEIFSFSG